MTNLAAAVLASLAMHQPADERRFEFEQPHMGTLFRITLYAADEKLAKKAAEAAFARIQKLDDIMSDYKDSSELMQLCKQAGGPPVKVSSELFFILQKSQELAERSGGAFDVTAAPVIQLWRRARRQQQLPPPERLKAAMQLVGHQGLKLDADQRTVQLTKPGMLLDLGGIGKGYAADEAMKVLKEQGIRRALVAAGGDLVMSDPPPGKKGWLIGIAPVDPKKPDATPQLLLANAAVSTSGDAEQFVEIDGKRYSHIIDPRTGQALVGRSRVTVVAPLGVAADGYDTAISVLGPKVGVELIEGTPNLSVLFVQITDEGRRVFESKGWATIPKPD
jgi:thiamine biosynthesis lipoprotein